MRTRRHEGLLYWHVDESLVGTGSEGNEAGTGQCDFIRGRDAGSKLRHPGHVSDTWQSVRTASYI
jgi:hypothetical protein